MDAGTCADKNVGNNRVYISAPTRDEVPARVSVYSLVVDDKPLVALATCTAIDYGVPTNVPNLDAIAGWRGLLNT